MGNIYNKYLLSQFIEAVRKGLMDKIEKLEITESTDVDELINRLTSEFKIHPLDLREAVPSEPIETQIEDQDMFGDRYKKKVFQINVRIPFDGDRDLFDCYPSTSTVVYLDRGVSINSRDISATITLDVLDPAAYNNAVARLIGNINANIPRINAEIAPWNGGLKSQIEQLLDQRKGVVAKKIDFMKQIGLRMNPKSNDFMIPPPLARKAIPIPVSETVTKRKKEDVPILQDAVYQDIKEVLYNVGKAIERKPSLYLDKHEEDLRDIFLLFLETRYESTSGIGEAFNKKGKTDILLKYAKDGSNLFVAECKVWKGQKKFFEAIDQLLGYLTHRDSKTALLIFVEQREFSSVVTTLKNEIRNHKQFKRLLKDTYDSSTSYEFTLPDDPEKVILLEVMLWHFPAIRLIT